MMKEKQKELQEFRELFCFKISMELKWFKLAVLGKKPYEIYDMAYEIDTMINIYEILFAMSENMDMETLQSLLTVSRVIAFLYEQWLKKEDSRMDEMQSCVASEIERIRLSKAA